MKFTHATTWTNAECQKNFNVTINDGTLCAYSGKNGTGVCFGDSGGPLVHNNKIIGVVSWTSSTGCANGLPDGFARVSEYIDWIEENMKTSTLGK